MKIIIAVCIFMLVVFIIGIILHFIFRKQYLAEMNDLHELNQIIHVLNCKIHEMELEMGNLNSQKTNETGKTIWQLELHETISIPSPDGLYERLWSVTRVPSGWLYESIMGGGCQFIPYIEQSN